MKRQKREGVWSKLEINFGPPRMVTDVDETSATNSDDGKRLEAF